MFHTYHVGKKGNDNNNGSFDSPFLTIQKAADMAIAGDTVIVHEGVYREWVQPKNKGNNAFTPITFEAAQGEKVMIKGSEEITGWKEETKGIWKILIDNTLFGDFNPFAEALQGDWFRNLPGYQAHLGSLYVNGSAFYEAKNLEDLKNPQKRKSCTNEDFDLIEIIPNPEKTLFVWYAKVEEKQTTLYANFHSLNPNKQSTEINVRKCCFMPIKNGINYITIRGFEMAQTATPWAAPTGEQLGLIGPHWSKGWIIENNTIHDAKCSGISLGKEISTGDNETSKYMENPGYQNQAEAVFKALKIGWSKETIGSHIVRNNTIYDCGQAGIVGHMGGIFSQIYNNHIYNIAVRHEFTGSEMGGIKLHAAIDVSIIHNVFQNCTLGLWLDWEAQGVRVSKNIFFNNNMDAMVEVSHGPYLFDNNIFASSYNFNNVSQGGAFIHNLFLGYTTVSNVLIRSTPYHVAHSTEIAGYSSIFSYDDRYYNNIFIGNNELPHSNKYFGTTSYNGCPVNLEAFHQLIMDNKKEIYLRRFINTKQPAYINGNIYLHNAKPFSKEKEYVYLKEFDPHVTIEEKNGTYCIDLNLPQEIEAIKTQQITSQNLGKVRIAKQIFDDPLGNEINMNDDINGHKRGEKPTPGPFEHLKKGHNRIVIQTMKTEDNSNNFSGIQKSL